jgi:protein involved in polysaccharide export with SLBB domain
MAAGLLLTLGNLGSAPFQSAQAQQMPSQEQIQQLRSLPRAQQEQLARQFGIDIQMLDQLEGQDSRSQERAQQEQDIVFPRGTRFDDYGDPIIPEDIERQFRRGDSELEPFGYDIFAAQPRTFAPTSHAPVPSNYIMGVGDTIQIQLFGQENRNYELVIDREGKIVIPEIGEVSVAGLTYSSMRELVQHQVSQRLIGYKAAVSMGELRSIQIFVVGEAYQPGAYTVSSLSTISQALYVAGGVSDIASLRDIRLMRGGEVAARFDLYDLLMRGDASADRMLQSGDVVFIPTRGEMITVKGEVKRPALYELKGGETLEDALELAGGETPQAYLASTQILRIEEGRRLISTVDMTEEANQQRPVSGGAEITLPAVSASMDMDLLLVGAVSRPGSYEFRDGMHINDVLRSERHDLLEQADLSYGLVVRESGPRRQITVHQFDVALAIDGNEKENLELEERDQILIFSRYETTEEERLKLSELTLTRAERERAEREKMLEDYRKAFLRNLVDDEQGEDEEQENRLADADRMVPLRELFGSVEEEEVLEEEDYSQYSRTRMLEPLMQRMRTQRTESGETPFVHIAGEVRHPGIYPLVENATVSRLVAAAGGLEDSAYLQRSEITRVNLDSGEVDTDYISFDLMDVVLGNEDIALHGRDRVNILSIPEWQNTYEVTLRGEVRFPGTYAIRRGESLKALIERAGGFTDYAFLDGAVFTREELREQERERQAMLAEELQREIASNAITGTGGSTRSYNEMRTLLRDLMSVEPIGRLIIDLPEILANNGASGDVKLKDGDTLHIPSRSDTVSIMGEVQMATSYRYNDGLSVNDYISKSGGTKQKADTDRIYVVKANGSVEPHRQRRGWFSHSGSADLEPGDAIVVPLDTTYMENLELWSQVTGIIYNSAVAIAAINGI